ncbi:hypothetical protein [Glycomyces sp. NPDC047010]|uniref:hypothetical protein n=1 Tax=Glycomyces sp. NPDC047010 TaxID=3155023 RepID=UPI0033C4F3A7
MRRFLKFVLLLGIGLAFAKPGGSGPKGPDDSTPITPNGTDPADSPKVKTPGGTNAVTNWGGAKAEIDKSLDDGEIGDGTSGNPPETPATPTTEPKNPDKWASQQNLDNHYQDHGEEMGFESQIEYREAAIDLMSTDGGRRDGVQIKRDGEVAYFFDPATGEFGASGPRGIITYFTPDDPADYFRRQPGTEV